MWLPALIGGVILGLVAVLALWVRPDREPAGDLGGQPPEGSGRARVALVMHKPPT